MVTGEAFDQHCERVCQCFLVCFCLVSVGLYHKMLGHFLHPNKYTRRLVGIFPVTSRTSAISYTSPLDRRVSHA